MPVDLKEIYERVDSQMTLDEKKHLMDEMVSTIRAQFLYITDNDDGRYCFTLEQAYRWIGNEVSDYPKAKKNFKARYLFIGEHLNPSDSVFDRAESEKDKFKDYFIKKVGKSEEIMFSVRGFQTFCMSQNKGIKAKAVKKYFLVLQDEYIRSIRESDAEHRNRCKQLESEMAKLKQQNADGLTDSKTSELLKAIEDRRQSLEVEVFNRESELASNKRHTYKVQCAYDEADALTGIRALASSVIRGRFLKHRYDILLIDPEIVKARTKNRKAPAKLSSEPKKIQIGRKNMDEEMTFSSDEDRNISTRKKPEIEAGMLNPYSEDDYVLNTGVITSEPYSEQFSTMDACDLEPGCCYFFAIAPAGQTGKHFNGRDSRLVGMLEFSTSAEVKYAVSLLGPPVVQRPYRIYLTTYDTIKGCADQAIYDLAQPDSRNSKNVSVQNTETPALDRDSDSDEDVVRSSAEIIEAREKCRQSRLADRKNLLAHARTKKHHMLPDDCYDIGW